MPNARYVFEFIQNVTAVIEAYLDNARATARIGQLLGLKLMMEAPSTEEFFKLLPRGDFD